MFVRNSGCKRKAVRIATCTEFQCDTLELQHTDSLSSTYPRIQIFIFIEMLCFIFSNRFPKLFCSQAVSFCSVQLGLISMLTQPFVQVFFFPHRRLEQSSDFSLVKSEVKVSQHVSGHRISPQRPKFVSPMDFF